MAFTDLLTSSRGPGVIGTLLALLVLVGFGTLYMFVFDEGLQGGKKTIESVIRDQAAETETLKIQIANAKQRIEDAKQLKELAREADEIKVRSELDASRITELTGAREEAESASAGARDAWEKYKDEYRASEWAAAEGEKLDDIQTPSGEDFVNVVISKVDHTGMRISHSSGSKTIPPDDLPAELHDRFQFSKEKTAVVREEMDDDFEILSNNVEIARLAEKAQAKLAKSKELTDEIQNLTARIQRAKSELPRQQGAVDRQRAALAAEKAKRRGISRAPEMQVKLSAMDRVVSETRRSIPANQRKISDNKRQIQLLEREVEQIKEQIARIKRDLADKELAEKEKASPQP